ncbi:MAG: hypothetical protein HY791_22840 [Deltaproteobacteria bacterium]|nr:hypothetical protein [Deltaproteobacteria bacterium]
MDSRRLTRGEGSGSHARVTSERPIDGGSLGAKHSAGVVVSSTEPAGSHASASGPFATVALPIPIRGSKLTGGLGVLYASADVMGFVREMWAFLKERKKFWLLPILLMMALLGGLIVLSQGSAVAPFIYTLF